MWRNRIILGVLILGCVLFASNYGGRIAYSLLYFVLILPVTALLYTVYVFFRFRFYQEIRTPKVIKEEPAEFHFTLNNESHITFTGIQVRTYNEYAELPEIDNCKKYTLLPGEKEVIHTAIYCKYRGEYCVGVHTLVVSDFLNLFQIAYPVLSKLQITVFPIIKEWNYPELIIENEDEKFNFYSGNKEEILDFQVRKYQTGDSLKRINWKTSAKSRELISRTSQSIVKNRLLIYFDLKKAEADEITCNKMEDSMIETCLALVHYCFEERIPCSLLFKEKEIQKMTVTNQEEFDFFYKWCAKVRFQDTNTLSELMEMVPLQREEESHVFCITHILSKEITTKLFQKSSEGQKIRLLLIDEVLTGEKAEYKKSLENSGIPVLAI